MVFCCCFRCRRSCRCLLVCIGACSDLLLGGEPTSVAPAKQLSQCRQCQCQIGLSSDLLHGARHLVHAFIFVQCHTRPTAYNMRRRCSADRPSAELRLGPDLAGEFPGMSGSSLVWRGGRILPSVMVTGPFRKYVFFRKTFLGRVWA
jgi:hypothetical protein